MKISWKAKKNHLCKLIKEVSDMYGGDDIEWLREYAKEVIVQNAEDLDKAIDCFQSLMPQSKVIIKPNHN